MTLLTNGDYTVLRLFVSIPPQPFDYIIESDVCGNNVGSPWRHDEDEGSQAKNSESSKQVNVMSRRRNLLFWDSFVDDFVDWVEGAVEDTVEFVSDVGDAIVDAVNDIVQEIAIDSGGVKSKHFFDTNWFPGIFDKEYEYSKESSYEVTFGTKPKFIFTGTGTMTIKAGYDIDLSITLDFSFRWVVLTEEIKVFFQLNVDYGLTSWFGVELVGEVEARIENLLKFGKIFTFFIGPVPVVIKPFIAISARITTLPLRIYAGITCHYGEVLKVGYNYDNGNGNDIKSRTPHSNNGCEKVFEMGSEEENEEDCPAMQLGFDVALEVKIGANLYSVLTVYGKAVLVVPFRIMMPQFDTAICPGADTSCSNSLQISFTYALNLEFYLGIELDFSTIGDIVESVLSGTDIDVSDDFDALETLIWSVPIIDETSLGCINLFEPFNSYYRGKCCSEDGTGSNPAQGIFGYINFGQTKKGSITEGNQIIKYVVKLETTTSLVIFEACDSLTDTYLYFYDSNMNIINECDDCNDHTDCGTRGDLTITNVAPGTYYFGVGTFSTNTGAFTVRMIPEEGTILLVDGSNEYEGRIEITHDQTMGTICDHAFGSEDGTVVCNQLGYDFGRVADYGEFSAGEGQIWLDDVSCGGSESSLSECGSLAWGSHNCAHDEDVGVVCIGAMYIGETKTGAIRANEIKKYKVIIEQHHNLIVFESCVSNYDTYLYFYDSNMNVINECDDCNDYGYSCGLQGDLKVINVAPGIYYLGIGGYSDKFGNYIVASFIDNTQDGAVRLAGGSNKYEGRLEIFHNYEWGSVCDDYFEDVDGEVVCRELGLDFDKILTNTNYSRFGDSYGQIWLDDIGCSGAEYNLASCSNLGWAVHNCAHSEDVHLRCKGVINPHETNVGSIVANEIIYYRVNFNEDKPWVIFESCGSNYDTYVYFYDSNMNLISYCDDCNDFGAACDSTGDLGIADVSAGTYYFGIGGYSDHFGFYKIKMYIDYRNGPYSLSASESDGNYISSIKPVHNGKEVYTRQKKYGSNFIFWNGGGYGWIIGPAIGGGYFDYCNKENLFECPWFNLCLKNAYDSTGVYKANGNIYNGKPVFRRDSRNGDPRYMFWFGNGYGWLISTEVGGDYFSNCNRENFWECDESNFGIDPECNDMDVSAYSQSYPNPSLFIQTFAVYNKYFVITFILIVSILIIYCCYKKKKISLNHKYKSVAITENN
eukprot:520030_1